MSGRSGKSRSGCGGSVRDGRGMVPELLIAMDGMRMSRFKKEESL